MNPPHDTVVVRMLLSFGTPLWTRFEVTAYVEAAAGYVSAIVCQLGTGISG